MTSGVLVGWGGPRRACAGRLWVASAGAARRRPRRNRRDRPRHGAPARRARLDRARDRRDPRHLPAALAAAGVTFSTLDRADPEAAARLSQVVGEGADLSSTARASPRATRTAAHGGGSGRVDGNDLEPAVYVDAAGNHVNGDVQPVFEGPVPETAPTLVPAAGTTTAARGTGRTRSRPSGAARLRPARHRATALEGARRRARNPREWVFVQPLLAGRRTLLLAHPDAVDHTTAAVNTAALIETVATLPGARVLNSADPDAPTVLGIARAVAAALGQTWDQVVLDPDDGGGRPDLDAPPGRAPRRSCSTRRAAAALGYTPSAPTPRPWRRGRLAGGAACERPRRENCSPPPTPEFRSPGPAAWGSGVRGQCGKDVFAGACRSSA